uniref:Uncharacterized protein n=1 Tax=Leersia perrieri TaxID=77586 RepID=A0A0D9VVK6_9ORYZ
MGGSGRRPARSTVPARDDGDGSPDVGRRGSDTRAAESSTRNVFSAVVASAYHPLPRRGLGWAASRWRAWACSNGGTGPFLELYMFWLVVMVPTLTGVLSASHDLAFLFTAWPVHFMLFAPYSKALMRASMLGFAANHALALLKGIQQNYAPPLHPHPLFIT